MIKRLHHVAVAVESIPAALGFYHDILGLTNITIKTLKDRGLKVALIQAGESEIELLEPTSEDSTVRRFLDRRGSGLHHICFQVDDIEAAMRELGGRGAEFIEPVPREGAVGLVSFMPPAVADGVLVELAQVAAPHKAPAEAESAPSTPSAEAEVAQLAEAGEPAPPITLDGGASGPSPAPDSGAAGTTTASDPSAAATPSSSSTPSSASPASASSAPSTPLSSSASTPATEPPKV